MMEASLQKISENFTNDLSFQAGSPPSCEDENCFRAGSKCALLRNLETGDHKYTPVQTKVFRGMMDKQREKQEWSVLNEKEILQLIDNLDHNTNDSRQLSNITVLNWDLSCHGDDRRVFYGQVIKVLERILPDFCCFQNVQHEFRATMKQSKILGRHYYLSNSNLDYIDFVSHTHHGLLTLSRWPCEFMEYPFTDTHVGRYLLVAQTILNGAPLIVAHSCLDNKKRLRSEKIRKAGEILSRHEHVLWLGEFGDMESNIRATLSSYKDTEDIAEGKHSKSDRILVKSDRLKPLHYFNLDDGIDDYEGMEVRNSVVGVFEFLH